MSCWTVVPLLEVACVYCRTEFDGRYGRIERRHRSANSPNPLTTVLTETLLVRTDSRQMVRWVGGYLRWKRDPRQIEVISALADPRGRADLL